MTSVKGHQLRILIIIITHTRKHTESAGGNLASALCVAIAATIMPPSSSSLHQAGLASLKETIQEIYGHEAKKAEEEEKEKKEGGDSSNRTIAPCLGSTQILHQLNEEKEILRLPDALILFYPVLNFCLSPSPSRVSYI